MSDENYKKIFSKNLLYYMKKQNIKQVDIAKRFGIAKSTVSSWCSGEKIPRMDKIELLSMLFDINKSDLLEEKKHTKNDVPKENVVIFHRNGKTAELKLSEEKMNMFVKMIEAFKDEDTDL